MYESCCQTEDIHYISIKLIPKSFFRFAMNFNLCPFLNHSSCFHIMMFGGSNANNTFEILLWNSWLPDKKKGSSGNKMKVRVSIL